MASICKTQKFLEEYEVLDSNTKGRIQRKIESYSKYPDQDLLDILRRNQFGPNFYMLKLKYDNLRLPIQTVELPLKTKKVIVFFLLDILKKDEAVYKELEDKTKKHARQKIYFDKVAVADKSIKRVHNELLEQEANEIKLPELPYEVNQWLNINRDWYEGNDEWIFESAEWVDKTQKRSFKENEFVDIYNLLTEYFINNANKDLIKANDFLKIYPNVHILSLNNVHILFETIYAKNNKRYYFLYDFQINDKIDLQKKQELLNKLYRRSKYDDLSGYAMRAYPSYVLVDRDIWKEIEVNERTNLALSSEELYALYKVKLPIFINGQAGSGKSTILYYLFSDFLYEKFQNDLTGRPIFLTFSKALVEDAKKNIELIFKSYSKYVDKTDILSIIGDNFSDYFYRYSELLIKILKDFNEISQNFSPKHLIDFNTFRTLYNGETPAEFTKAYSCNLAECKKYSSEIAWHVIRTYIKGYKTEGDLTPEEYRKIPDEDQTVTYETYNDIFHSIWAKWYKKFNEEYGLYDQQDLTRKVIKLIKEDKNRNRLERFPAIFCDEAQDFTRIELDFILRISSFYGYNLISIDEIPLAFAGDPFQTINPTGFRWEFLKSTFYTKFKELNFPVRISEINLTVNFRSNSKIVEFANLIQFFRQMWIDSSLLKKVKPQESGVNIFDEAPPLRFIISDALTKDELKEIISRGNVVIIPAEYDAEEEYIQKHQEFFPKDEKLNNVFSPLKVKGMEHGKIIILNFGQEYGKLFKDINSRELNKNEEIELEYILNKIYVSITRARRNLYIIDTKEGIQELWDLFNKYWYDKYYSEVDDSDVKKNWAEEVVEFLNAGSRANLKELMDADLGEIAEELEKAGIAQENPELLKRAAHYYYRNSQQSKYLECLAKAYELTGEYEKAGDKWRDSLVNKPDEALECYWKGMCWDRISEFYRNNKLKHAIAEFMLNDEQNLLIPQLVRMFQANLIQEIKPFDKTWNQVIDTIYERLDKPSNKITQSDFYKLISYLEEIGQKGFRKFYDLIAKFLFSIKDYSGAISFWERGYLEIKTPQYYEAKFHISDDIDEKIKYAEKSSMIVKEKEILKIWQTNTNFSFSDESIKAIKKAYKKSKKPTDKEYIKFLISNFNTLDDIREVMNLYEKFSEADAQLETDIIKHLFNNPDWYKLISELKQHDFIKNNIELVIENILAENYIDLEKAEFIMDYLADLHSENVPIEPSLLIKYYYLNKIYLIPFRSKVNSFMKKMLFEEHLSITEINEKEKYFDFQKPYFGTNWMYIITACIANNDEIYFIDRIQAVKKIIDYSYAKHNKEMYEWAKNVWIYLQNGYIQRREKAIKQLEEKGSPPKEIKHYANVTDKERKRLQGKIDEWKIKIPKNLPECPFDLKQLAMEHPFIYVPDEAEIKIHEKYSEMDYLDYQIKCFKDDGRVVINNDTEDIQIKILSHNQEITSMTEGFYKRKRKNGFLDFSIKNKPIKGSVGKKGLIELDLGEGKVKIQL
ncbi:UvrD-helicase domain-containing protein [Calditrichota bacterium GD2]